MIDNCDSDPCNYMWTNTNGTYYHRCGLCEGHTEDHKCAIKGCEETHPL